jgi:hypothetical protein
MEDLMLVHQDLQDFFKEEVESFMILVLELVALLCMELMISHLISIFPPLPPLLVLQQLFTHLMLALELSYWRAYTTPHYLLLMHTTPKYNKLLFLLIFTIL